MRIRGECLHRGEMIEYDSWNGIINFQFNTFFSMRVITSILGDPWNFLSCRYSVRRGNLSWLKLQHSCKIITWELDIKCVIGYDSARLGRVDGATAVSFPLCEFWKPHHDSWQYSKK